jgi:prolipoprotein diacylglyceryltransferase
MEILVLIPALLIFLYTLYKLSGDDHVLIRKNISLEQMFDATFITLWFCLVLSRIYFFIFDQKSKGNVFIEFFTTRGGLSLTGAVVSGIIVLYLVAKYKKIPLGRLFDFFTLSFLFALPAGFAGIMLLHLKQPVVLIAYGVSAVIYLVSAILFRRFLFPKLLNRSIKEGTISVYFLFLFTLVSFGVSLIHTGKTMPPLLTTNTYVLIGLLVAGMILFINLQRSKLRKRL